MNELVEFLSGHFSTHVLHLKPLSVTSLLAASSQRNDQPSLRPILQGRNQVFENRLWYGWRPLKSIQKWQRLTNRKGVKARPIAIKIITAKWVASSRHFISSVYACDNSNYLQFRWKRRKHNSLCRKALPTADTKDLKPEAFIVVWVKHHHGMIAWKEPIFEFKELWEGVFVVAQPGTGLNSGVSPLRI